MKNEESENIENGGMSNKLIYHDFVFVYYY